MTKPPFLCIIVWSQDFFMSLISQQDRDLAIEALDFYLFSKGNDFAEAKRAEVNALLNWIKLEKTKNEH